MEEDMQSYANSLRARATRMEQSAQTVRLKQKESVRRQAVMTKSFHEELNKLELGLSQLDVELHRLARDVRRFVKTFQGLGMLPQLSVLQERIDALKVDQWMNRREFERIRKELENEL